LCVVASRHGHVVHWLKQNFSRTRKKASENLFL